MKNFILIAAAFVTLLSCQNNLSELETPYTNIIAQRGCATHEVLEEQLKQDPQLALKMNQIEAFTQKTKLTGRMVTGKIIIPVVVNVLYKTDEENISDEQIQSQIDVLNEDFSATNSDYNSIPSEFEAVAADVGISFKLVKIERKSTKKKSWGTRDAMKISKRGGIDPTSPKTTLNIWACSIGGGILGYAQFPGGKDATDGIVIDSFFFGKSSIQSYPYNLGRTGSHEVGHWMNLRHIWGDSSCGDDYVADTPVHKTYNFGVPLYPYESACLPPHNEMTMNYMDYTDDRGMYMFTLEQKSRMRTIFAKGGPRDDFGG